MVEGDRAHARLRLHHHAFGQMYADILGLEQFPYALLIVQVGTRRIADAVALAVIPGGEAIVHGHGERIGEAPILVDAAVQPLRGCLGGFDGELFCSAVWARQSSGAVRRDSSSASAGGVLRKNGRHRRGIGS